MKTCLNSTLNNTESKGFFWRVKVIEIKFKGRRTWEPQKVMNFSLNIEHLFFTFLSRLDVKDKDCTRFPMGKFLHSRLINFPKLPDNREFKIIELRLYNWIYNLHNYVSVSIETVSKSFEKLFRVLNVQLGNLRKILTSMETSGSWFKFLIKRTRNQGRTPCFAQKEQ